ncbi:MAG: DUF3037 domain-containing protein [Chloroflexota bacterium]
MPGDAFEYAILRLVPRVERGERINVGVVLFCRTRRFIDARVSFDPSRRAALTALAPEADEAAILEHLAVIQRIVQGDATAGPIAQLAAPERFRWVASPSSTMIQPSEVHSGVTEDPAATLDQIFAGQVG